MPGTVDGMVFWGGGTRPTGLAVSGNVMVVVIIGQVTPLQLKMGCLFATRVREGLLSSLSSRWFTLYFVDI